MAVGYQGGSKSLLRGRAVEYAVYVGTGCVVALLSVLAILTLQARGIHAGFGFLWDTAGFDIGFGLIPFDATKSYARAFLVGLLNTLFVSALAIGLATIFGLALAVARLSGDALLRSMATTVTELVRNTPLLLQLLVWYGMVFSALPPVRQSIHVAGFALINNRGIVVATPGFAGATLGCLVAGAALGLVALLSRRLAQPLGVSPRALGLAASAGALCLLLGACLGADWDLPRQRGFNVTGGLTLPPEFAALVCALAIYAAAFIGEAFRSGFVAVPASQWEAAQSLGLRRLPTLRLIILPQAIRAALPALGNQFVNVVKASSLAAAVGFPDLMQVFGKTTLNQTGQAVEVIGITMAVYLVISLAISALVHRCGAPR